MAVHHDQSQVGCPYQHKVAIHYRNRKSMYDKESSLGNIVMCFIKPYVPSLQKQNHTYCGMQLWQTLKIVNGDI